MVSGVLRDGQLELGGYVLGSGKKSIIWLPARPVHLPGTVRICGEDLKSYALYRGSLLGTEGEEDLWVLEGNVSEKSASVTVNDCSVQIGTGGEAFQSRITRMEPGGALSNRSFPLLNKLGPEPPLLAVKRMLKVDREFKDLIPEWADCIVVSYQNQNPGIVFMEVVQTRAPGRKEAKPGADVVVLPVSAPVAAGAVAASAVAGAVIVGSSAGSGSGGSGGRIG